MFVASVAGTLVLRGSMVGAMPMSAPMPEQGRLGRAAFFLAMWVVMMVAMMMPSLVPTLSRYRRLAPDAGGARPGLRTALVGAGYFSVWAGIGVAAYLAGALWQEAGSRWAGLARSAPLAAAGLLLAAGLVQFTGWKARQLGRCRAATCAFAPGPGAGGAWRHGLESGVACALCCAGFMTVLLVAGVMDLRVMVVVAAAITFERLAPWPAFAARAAGVLAVAAGAFALVRAVGAA